MPKDLEQSWIGSVLMDPQVFYTSPIEVEDFEIQYHKNIHIAIKNTLDKHGKLDLMLLSQQFEDIGYLTECITSVGSALNADAYAEEIRKAAMKRDMKVIATQMVNDAEPNPSGYIDMITNAIRVQGGDNGTAEAIEMYRQWMEFRQENKSDVWGIPTPWHKFNKITGGLHKKEGILIYGVAGTGKTVMVLQMAYHAAVHGYKVDIYEMEMPKEKVISRMVAMYSNVPPDEIDRGTASEYQLGKVRDGMRYISELPIRIYDNTDWTSATIRADQQKKGKDRADLVIIDYLALLQDKADNEHQAVERAAKATKRMAKDLNFALVTIGSQVKDGSIRGPEEVKHAQDQTWYLERISQDMNDPARDLVPSKGRYMGEFKKIPLQFKPGVPVLEERL